ncbi:hypothetical protein SAY86_000288 [Trapa natans]|uniref:Uncharacterized protein n=1 Tax=Trapa natans TaxID=22666 RepID=A0AAN7RGH9_TRANT|nr:hypothetical protein SAY86_000288 [Trapa natans]
MDAALLKIGPGNVSSFTSVDCPTYRHLLSWGNEQSAVLLSILASVWQFVSNSINLEESIVSVKRTSRSSSSAIDFITSKLPLTVQMGRGEQLEEESGRPNLTWDDFSMLDN